MSMRSYGCCYRDGRACKHGPPLTAVYVSGGTGDELRRQAEYAAAHARVRAWKVTRTVVEVTPELPLEERKGWQDVMVGLVDGATDVILVHSPRTVGLDVANFELLKADFRNREAVLTAATGVPVTYPSLRRSKVC